MNWHEIVQNHIIKNATAVKKVTQPLKDHFGITYFTYHRIDNSGKYTVLLDRPDWAENYVEQKIYLLDPFLRDPKVYKSGICQIENHGSDEYKTQVMKEGKRVLDSDLCTILIDKKADGVEFFGFCGKSLSSSLEKIYLNNTQLLYSFATHFKKELSPILNKIQKEANTLQNLKGHDYFSSELIHPLISSDSLEAYLKSVGLGKEVEMALKLSQREKECLYLLLQNKTAKETAAFLEISSRTVESYFENIKNKLNCSDKYQVFDIAKKLHTLKLLP